MPVNSIIYQPTTAQLLAAYRPIVFRVEATSTGGDAVPPYVVCDIYLSDIYYKSIIRTAPKSFTALLSTWEFDISDALQEYLQPDIAAIDNSDLLQATHMSAKVFCKFRSSDIDADGFTVEEATKPVQATRFTAAVSGTGLQSNDFFAINSALQHEDNQNLALHLDSFKQGAWKPDAYPLTHRNRYFFCNNDSDHYPVIFTGACLSADLVLNYRLKGQTIFNQATALDLNVCDPINYTVSVTGNQVNVDLDIDPPGNQYVVVHYKKQADSTWIFVNYFHHQNIQFNVNGPSIAGDYDIRVILFCTACLSATPVQDTFTLSGTVINTAWRGINPFCVVQNFSPPVYVVLGFQDINVEPDVFFPDNINPIYKRSRETKDLYANFFSDPTHLTPVVVTQLGLKVYVKKIETRADDTGTGVYNRITETLQVFTVDAAGDDVLLADNIVTSEDIENYSAYPIVSSSSSSQFAFEMYPDHILLGGNTGNTGYATLEEYNTGTGTPTGVTKPNDSGDPDYIPPFSDPLTCPTGPDVTTASYGSNLEIAKVEANYGTSVYFDTVTDTEAGGYQYLRALPRNINTTVTVKVRRLTGGTGPVKARVYYVDSGGTAQMSEFDVPSNIETTLPQVFQNITMILISQT